MARQPRLIDLLRYPKSLRFGDIIGVESVTQKQLLPALNSSGNRSNPEVFEIPNEPAPKMRAMFMGYNYDSQHHDKISSLSVMLMAPTSIMTRIDNTSHTLMINKIPDKKSMGVDTERNWRLVYIPMNIPVSHHRLGVAEDSTVLKYGDIPPRLLDTIENYIKKLEHDDHWRSHGYLTKRQRRQLRGEQAQGNFDKIATSTAVNQSHLGGQRDARAAEDIDARRAAEEKLQREAQKAAEVQREKDDLKRQKETPSGRLAFNKVKLRFNEQADPDISLTSAHEAKLISEDDLLYIETIAPALGGISSLRGAYDAVSDHPVRAMSELVKEGICTETEAIDFKKSLDARLKDGLVQFFDRSRQKNNDLGDKIIPYTRPSEPSSEPEAP